MSSAWQDEHLIDAVRRQVTAWQARASRVADGDDPDLPDTEYGPFYADAVACVQAQRAREVLLDPVARDALMAFVDAVLAPGSATAAAARHPAAHAALVEAGVDLTLVGSERSARSADGGIGRARQGLGGLFASLTDTVEAVTARVAPHRTVARSALQVRTLLRTPIDPVVGELDEDLVSARHAELSVDAELVGTPVVGPAGAERLVGDIRRELLSRNDLRSVTVSVDDLAPEAFGVAARAAVRAAAVAAGKPGGMLAPTPAALAQFGERVRPLLRAAREAEVDLVLRATPATIRHTVDVLVELALEPEFGYVTPYVEIDPGSMRDAAELIGRLRQTAEQRLAEGGRPMGVRLVRGATAEAEFGADDALHRTLDEVVQPDLASLLDVVVASDRYDDHAVAQALADARPGAAAPRALLGIVCPPERSWTLGQDLDASISLLVVPAPPTGADSETAGAQLATATARVVHRLANEAVELTTAQGDGGDAGAASGAGYGADPDSLESLAGDAADSGAQLWAGALTELAVEELRELVLDMRIAGENWAQSAPEQRALALEKAADAMVCPLSEASEAVRVLADGARRITQRADGVSFTPDRLVVALPSTAMPGVGTAVAAAGALAAGSAVLVLVSPEQRGAAQSAAAQLREALAAAGAPSGLLRVLPAAEPPQELLELDEVDSVVVADPLLAREIEAWRVAGSGAPKVITGPAGPSAMVITGSAPPELAAADLVASAFAGAGALPGSVSTGYLVGDVADSARLREAILDAVASLPPLPPVLTPSGEETPELQRARSLDVGERWLLEPRRVGADGAWTPGVKAGVAAGGHMATARIGGPVLGLLDVATLGDALRIINQANGLVAACWSNDPEECRTFTTTATAPHLVLRRPSIGGVHPVRGVAAAVGAAGWDGPVALGPDVPGRLGSWVEDTTPEGWEEPSDPARLALIDYTGIVLNQADRSWLRSAVGSDAQAFARSLVRVTETAEEGPDVVLLRRLAVPHAWVRAGSDTAVVELVRVLVAAATLGVEVSVSLAPALSNELKSMEDHGEPARQGLRRLTPHVDRVEDASSFAARIRSGSVGGRVRVLGAEAAVLPAMVAGRGVDLATEPVSAQGALELGTLLRGQTLTRPREFGPAR